MITFIASIPEVLVFYSPMLNHPGYILGAALTTASPSGRYSK